MKPLFLSLLILAASAIQAQNLILEFNANHTCAQVNLDSIWIENLTQGGKMVLYYPDNTANLIITDIGEFDPEHNHLYVSQNYPNPFSALTYIDVYLATPDAVSLIVYDLKGRTVTDIDGNVYQTVIIGDQEWMAENLRVTRDANGNEITRYCYGDNTTNCELYGGLYTWHTVINGESSRSSNPSNVKGICPSGWHVPSDEEWSELVNHVASQGFPNRQDETNGAGNALKSCRQANSPFGGDCDTSEHPRWNQHGTHYGFDEFGFSALPGGLRYASGNFIYHGSNGRWWSSSETSPIDAWQWSIYHYSGYVSSNNASKSFGFSLRCVRDN